MDSACTTPLVNRKRRISRKERKQTKKKCSLSQTSNGKAVFKLEQQTQSQSSPPPTIPTTPAEIPDVDTYLNSYVPVTFPKSNAIPSQKQTKSVGRWFPSAIKLKRDCPCTKERKSSIMLFYQYVEPVLSNERLDHWRACLLAIADQRENFAGRLRIAPEGVNCTVSAIDTDDRSAAATLRHVVMDLKRLDDIFAETDFKFFDNLSSDRHFSQFTLIPVKELVYYGGWTEAETSIRKLGGKHVTPQEFHALLEDPGSIVVDVRNHYEAAIGRFDGQQAGARYVDPKLRKSTDFTEFVQTAKETVFADKKRVLLYCTGGIRCERASAHLKAQLRNDDMEVCQLQGGIERYLQTFPDGGHWRGKNFTFDKREAVAPGNPNGDGGVLGKQIQPVQIPGCECCVCGTAWDRYIGKKKCTMCGVPVLMCNGCLEGDKKRDPMLVRCPLCVEQDVTVPAKDVAYTNNGVTTAVPSTMKGKAAPSVLKWGGGHAAEKKQRRKLKAKACKFGSRCTRPDCFFAHPG